uniref:Uncharacterized protein n=1 Tax=Hemiselmis tepida TaxID=464990 RepID=A0A7S0YI15_9CRYP|mmetsp:Transcript_10994/g.28558  ORF Transcript_10994/g.28558 Transcript_10994/m.28558 type:complete len:249 (+) Transcript_10994:3-749(+)
MMQHPDWRLVGLAGVWLMGTASVLLFADNGAVRLEALQRGGGNGGGLRRAIAGLEDTERDSTAAMQRLSAGGAGVRMSQLAASFPNDAPGTPNNWLEEIEGKDTTHDMKYISGLPAGDVDKVGYEGMPQMKGFLPSYHEMTAADALLKKAIDSGTMPKDVTNVWDGKEYEPDPAFNQQISDALAGFHQALGEKKWEKLVNKNCGGKVGAACKEITDAKQEGYDTKWDGKEWKQWDGTAWNKLEHDSLV